MSYLDVNKFSFDDESLRGFTLSDIDELKTNITDVKVVFQKNRAIVFNIVIDDVNTIKYLNKESVKIIKGSYYHYSFIATVESSKHAGVHPPFFTCNIVIDLIDFSKDETFFINSDEKYNLEIIPTKNMIKYMDRIKQDNLFKFENIDFNDYNLKYRHLLKLNSLIYNTPILIEKVIIKNETTINILFESQNVNEYQISKLLENYPILKNYHFTCNLDKYLDNFVEFTSSQNTLDLLLKVYFLSDVFNGKEDYHLNDISGFIDLFDGVFYKLDGKKENVTRHCKSKNCETEYSFDKEYSLGHKINFILDKLEPELKKYKLDTDETQAKILSSFRNMTRHQLLFKKYDLNKLYTFSMGLLKLYIIKYILKIDKKDYNLNSLLSDFNIYPLVKHKYKYLNHEIIIYNTKLDNYGNKILNENSTYYQTLISNPLFNKAKPTDFIYDDSFVKEIKKIYIDNNDEIRSALIFFGIITMDKSILQNNDNPYYLDITYDELMNNLN
ncbi:MAG: hypothetical protein JJV94_05015 [Sulfurospirillum sp.]|nr:hypothetical protein [Sulfurospirillum sp.]